MNNIDYRLWPNTDGNLGNIKVQIPTGIGDDKWPEGDVLVGNFVYKDGKLAGFVDTAALILNDTATTTINYDYIDIYLPNIYEEELTVNRGERSKYFNVRYNIHVDGEGEGEEGGTVITFKYKGCKTVDDVKAVEPNYKTVDIIDGVWSEGLGDLTNGDHMFQNCTNLTSFTSDLSSLTNGQYMFSYCSQLASFSPDLPNLTHGEYMFQNCTNLTTFTSDLSSLTHPGSMFSGCTNLSSFSSDLPSLEYGTSMFEGCKLDALSVKNVIDTVNTTTGSLKWFHIGMGCNDTTKDSNLFAQEVGYADMTSLLTALSDKGWTVITQYNGRPTTTYGLRRPTEDTLPVFVKLEEVEETEDYADYTSEDGSKKYRLKWFHETTGSTEGYTQYATLEEAVETLNIKPIERN